MGHQAEPHYSKRHRRWFANIGERDKRGRATEVFAPRELGPRDKAEAWDWLRAELESRAKVVAVPLDAVTVEWVAQHYLAEVDVRHAAGDLNDQHARNKPLHLRHWVDVHGERVASTLTPADMTEFLRSLKKRFGPVYIRNIAATAQAALNWAVAAGHLERNTVGKFERPLVPASPERFAERAEAACFLRVWRDIAAHAGPVLGRYERQTILLERCLISTGARPGELCGLRWSDVKWDAGRTPQGHAYTRIVIPPERWKAGKKTGRPRVIYLTPLLSRALRRLSVRPGRDETHVFTHQGGRGGKGWGEPWASGSVLSKAVLRVRRAMLAHQSRTRENVAKCVQVRDWERTLAGLDLADDGANRLTNYRWRHTAASVLLMHGHDPSTVAELLGTSADMVARVYAHLLDRHLVAAAFAPRKRAG